LASEELLHGGLLEIALLGAEQANPSSSAFASLNASVMERCSGSGGSASLNFLRFAIEIAG
jgi:hypothetical protein